MYRFSSSVRLSPFVSFLLYFFITDDEFNGTGYYP